MSKDILENGGLCILMRQYSYDGSSEVRSIIKGKYIVHKTHLCVALTWATQVMNYAVRYLYTGVCLIFPSRSRTIAKKLAETVEQGQRPRLMTHLFFIYFYQLVLIRTSQLEETL